MDITGSVSRAPAARYGREAKEDGSLLVRLGEERGAGDVGPVGVRSEGAVGASTTGMHSALGDALVVEVLDLLAENEILEKRRPTLTDAEAVLIGDGATDIACEVGVGVIELELRQELVRLRGLSARLEVRVAFRDITGGNVGSHVGTADG